MYIFIHIRALSKIIILPTPGWLYCEDPSIRRIQVPQTWQLETDESEE